MESFKQRLLDLLDGGGRLAGDGRTLHLEDAEIPLLQAPTQDAARKLRSEWEPTAQELLKGGHPAGLLLLEDPQGGLRLSLIQPQYRGRLQPLLSDYRRHSMACLPGQGNKTFWTQAARLAAARTLEDLRQAFSVDAVSEEFYRDFAQRVFPRLLEGVRGVEGDQRAEAALALVARVLFLGFVEKKGWLGSGDFLKGLFGRYRKTGAQERFYQDWLRPLFFQALKAPPGQKGGRFAHLPAEVARVYEEAPYLNGELFAPKEGIDAGEFSDAALEGLWDFLFAYNFTVEENDRYEEALELNPELLGYILERLVNAVGVEGLSEELGAHYTPRTEVDLMVRLGLAEWLYRQGLDREAAYRILFGGEAAPVLPEVARQARGLLEEVRILDPAVGSGAFLVGAAQVLEEVRERLDRILGRVEGRLERRRAILRRNLFGTDALRWGVWMAELRLWLWLFVELPDGMRYSQAPLLPSLGLRVLHGDSLLQSVGGEVLPQRLPGVGVSARTLQELVELKERYFANQGVSLEQVDQKEREALREYIASSTGALLTAMDREGLRRSAPQLAAPLEALEALPRAPRRPFFWALDFVEELSRGGVDLIVGNPPYVRQESIRDPLMRPEFPKETYKEALIQEVQKAWPGLQVNRRSDLYAYFYALSLKLLNERGVHVFVASNSWLDVQYGAWLQELFLRHAPLVWVIENQARRSFRADVNTAITVAHAPGTPVREPVRFLAFRKPFEAVVSLEVFRKALSAPPEAPLSGEGFRVFPKLPKVLLEEGITEENEQEEKKSKKGNSGKAYAGGKWGGLYLRAPDIFFTLLEKGQGKLVRLGEVAEVRFGIKTGANEFFYLEPVGRTVKEVAELRKKDPMAPVRVKNGAGWEGEIEAAWLRPVLKSPQEVKTLRVHLEDLRYLVFMAPEKVRLQIDNKKDQHLGDYPLARAYIAWGEGQGYPKRSTLRGRRPWWDVGEQEPSRIILPMFERARKYVFLNDASLDVQVDNALYLLYFHKKPSPGHEKASALPFLLNSTPFGLFKEILARPPEGGGGGPIQMKVYHYEEMPIPDPHQLSFEEVPESFFEREIREFWDEVGLKPPSFDGIPNPQPDRKILDDIIFDFLGLTQKEREEVYRETARLVWSRISLAKSL